MGTVSSGAPMSTTPYGLALQHKPIPQTSHTLPFFWFDVFENKNKINKFVLPGKDPWKSMQEH
jgi:hypothetical protein